MVFLLLVKLIWSEKLTKGWVKIAQRWVSNGKYVMASLQPVEMIPPYRQYTKPELCTFTTKSLKKEPSRTNPALKRKIELAVVKTKVYYICFVVI